MTALVFLPGHVYLQRQMTGVTSVSTGTYRKTSIVPTSCTKHTAGVSPGKMGDRGNTYCTLSPNTPVLPPTEKRTEAWWQRREDERGGERVEGISTNCQIQKNMYKSYSLQALCSHIYSCHNTQQNRSTAGPSVSGMQVQGPTMREPSTERSEIKTGGVREVGEGGDWWGRGSGGGGCLSPIQSKMDLNEGLVWTLAGPYMGHGHNAAQCTMELKRGAPTNTLWFINFKD